MRRSGIGAWVIVGAGVLLAAPAAAGGIGALDSFFVAAPGAGVPPARRLAEERPAVLDPAVASGDAAPQADLLLDDAGAAMRLLPAAARRALPPRPQEIDAPLSAADPLLDAAPDEMRRLPADRARPPRPNGARQAEPAGSARLDHLFARASGPLRDAIRRSGDPIRAGWTLIAARDAALGLAARDDQSGEGRSGEAQAGEAEAPPPPTGSSDEIEALERRGMLIGLALMTLVALGGAVAYAFAPKGGVGPLRR